MIIGADSYREVHSMITSFLSDSSTKRVTIYFDSSSTPDKIEVKGRRLLITNGTNYGFIDEPTIRSGVSTYMDSHTSYRDINCILVNTGSTNSEVVFIRDKPNDPNRTSYQDDHPVMIFRSMYGKLDEAELALENLRNGRM